MRKLSILGMVAGLLAASFAAKADLVFNGSFEDLSSTFVPGVDAGTMSLPNGSTAIPGWQVLNVFGGDIAWQKSSDVAGGNPWGLKASQGNMFIDLTGYSNDSGSPFKGGIQLATTIPTTIGQTYRLTFDLGSSLAYDPGVNPVVLVSVTGNPAVQGFTGNGSLPDAGGFANHWENKTYLFTAVGTSTTLSFTGATPGTEHVLLLDNVSLTAVPEASTVLAGVLLLLPLAVSAVRIVRKNTLD